MTRLLILLIGLLLLNCQAEQVPDLAAERAAILALHHAQRDYHFNAQAAPFAAQLSAEFISVNRGMVSSSSYEENKDRSGDH